MSTQLTKPTHKTMEEKISDLRAKRAELEAGGGRERIEKQHATGKLTARERVEKLWMQYISGNRRYSLSIVPPCSVCRERVSC